MASQGLKEPPLIVIVGPTASGKSSIAIEIAKIVGGEIITADSRTIYKHLDVGTAKPTQEEQDGVVHWGLDLVEPNEKYSAADFKAYAIIKIAQIRKRGKVPILVGGTGLYVDSVIFDFQFGPAVNSVYRDRLENMSLQELYEYCYKNNIILPENSKNKRYVIRAIERAGESQKRRLTPIKNTIIVGITTDRSVLRQRIRDRVEHMFERGVVDEAKSVGKKYGWVTQSMTGNIYQVLRDYLDGSMELERAKEKVSVLDWRLAKRQLTWLRRNQYVEWMSLEQLSPYILGQLAKSS